MFCLVMQCTRPGTLAGQAPLRYLNLAVPVMQAISETTAVGFWLAQALCCLFMYSLGFSLLPLLIGDHHGSSQSTLLPLGHRKVVR